MGRNRRKKDEPFDPFAPDASAQRNRRMSEHKRWQRRNTPVRRNNNAKDQQDSKTADNELDIRSQEALDRLGIKDEKQTPNFDDENAKKILEMIERLGIPPFERDYKKRFEELMYGSTITGKISQENPRRPSREDRMAELRRKSEESRRNAKSQRKDGVDVQSEVQVPTNITKKKKSKTSSNVKDKVVQKSNRGSPTLRKKSDAEFDYNHRLKIIANERDKLEKIRDWNKQSLQKNKIQGLENIHEKIKLLELSKAKKSAKTIKRLKKDFGKKAS
jgi:hypothetical protein